MLDSDGKFCNWVNYYKCHHEDSLEEGEPASFWTDNWSACCNDKCPVCNHEIEPYHSVELEYDEEEDGLTDTEHLKLEDS